MALLVVSLVVPLLLYPLSGTLTVNLKGDSTRNALRNCGASAEVF